ncbi:exonuclease domain-containing protein [Sulfitobacter sp.]|uniref:exonuclease domain-containing protein n=1 Tax=Sulfitobacter sp. TaxID=1903071 RepID=UPI0025FD6867|nr:exonuclease domain-containing protein [Sulfitobacter sp.]
MSFIFFDTETTGLHAGFDQIVQFAAIRTDNDLNETDRFELRSRIDPNVVPDVQAMLANGLSIEALTDQHLATHYQMMRDLNERLVSWSPAIFVGYNSIRFDEEFLRHALYRTLHPPYLTSLHGNGRNDVMSLALACSASGDNALRVQLQDSGDPSFRLHDIAAANGIAVLKAHDAMFDTQTALELCRLVKKLSPDLWRRFVRFSNKASVADFVTSGEPFVLTEFYGNRAYHTPVVFVGNEPDQPNGMLCLSLVKPVEELASMSDEQLARWLLSPPRPIRRVRSNAGPTMMPLWEASEEFFVGASCEELEDRAARIVEDEGIKTRIERVFAENRAQYPEPAHVEEMLYTKFSSRNDATLCDRFHSAPWSERREIAQSFEDERLKELALRICYFECRSSLAPEVVQAMDIHLAHRLMSTDAQPPSVEQALRQVEAGRADFENDPNAAALLKGYVSFLAERRTKISKFLEAQ